MCSPDNTTKFEQNIKELVTDFVLETMKIRKNVTIKSVMRINNHKPSAVLVSLLNVCNKGIIFQKKAFMESKILRISFYYVNDQFT